MHSSYFSVYFLSDILPKHTKENVFGLFSPSNLLLVYHSTERDLGICYAFNSTNLMLLFVEFIFALSLTSKEPKAK